MERLSSADRVFQKKKETRTKDANANGGDHFRAGQFEDAAKCYSEAIEADSNPAELAKLLANRSAAYGRLGRLEAALADGKRAVELDPSYVKGYFRETKAHMALGQYSLASSAAAEGLRKQPENTELQQALQDANSKAADAPAKLTTPRAKPAVAPVTPASASASAARSTEATLASRAKSVNTRVAELEARLADAEVRAEERVQLVEAHAHDNVAEVEKLADMRVAEAQAMAEARVAEQKGRADALVSAVNAQAQVRLPAAAWAPPGGKASAPSAGCLCV